MLNFDNGLTSKVKPFFKKHISFYKEAEKKKLPLRERLISSFNNGKAVDYHSDPDIILRNEIHQQNIQISELNNICEALIKYHKSKLKSTYKDLKFIEFYALTKNETVDRLIDLDGIGKVTIQRLKEIGRKTIYDLCSKGELTSLSNFMNQTINRYTRELNNLWDQQKIMYWFSGNRTFTSSCLVG